MSAKFLLVLPLLLWSANAIAVPRTDAEIREAVTNIIIQRHPVDSPATWRGLGPNAPGVIIRMYEESSDSIERTKLVGGLAAFEGDARVADFLKRLAGESKESVIRQKSIAALGASQGGAAVDFLSKFLSDPDPQVRYAAASAIRRHSPEVVEAYIKTEKSAWIGDKLKGAAPSSPGKLTPVASSEDRASREFSGVWKGLMLSPDPVQGLASRRVEVRIDVRGAQELRLSVVLDPGEPKAQVFEIVGFKARGLFAQGAIAEKWAATDGVSKARSFQAEIETGSLGIRLILKSKETPVLLALRRVSPSAQ